MDTKRFKPKYDKMFYWIWIPMLMLMIALTALTLFDFVAFIIIFATDVFVAYFFFSSIVGYVELREKSVFVKFGFILKREIPYDRIRGLTRERRVYADSMLSIKNALDHINIKYNKFDMISVSVADNDELVREIELRAGLNKM